MKASYLINCAWCDCSFSSRDAISRITPFVQHIIHRSEEDSVDDRQFCQQEEDLLIFDANKLAWFLQIIATSQRATL
jgi:hypothetical protein